MRYCYLLLILGWLGCQSGPAPKRFHDQLAGDWLLVYPEHRLNNQRQRLIYGRIQDSIVGLKGLKLIQLLDNGFFHEMDSIHAQGKWGIAADSTIFVEGGGRGFEHFITRFRKIDGATLYLEENLNIEGEPIRLLWHIQKASGKAAALLDSARNHWRIKPAHPETDREIKGRLADMLEYYADYFQVVTKESSFFVPKRILLPVNFYQHAMGVKEYDEHHFFNTLFFDREQAMKAYGYLGVALRVKGVNYPRGDNYVKEYATFMKMMADQIRSNL